MSGNEQSSYLFFTRKERIAILSLLLLIIFLLFLPIVFPKGNHPGLRTAEQYEEELQQLAAVMKDRKEQQLSGGEKETKVPESASSLPVKNYEVFPFDPNILSPGDWKRMGIPEKTILTIQRYLAKGGRFRKPSDIERVYGIRPEDVRRLKPYIRIETVKNPENPADEKKIFEAANRSTWKKNPTTPSAVNINTADTTLFISLPGIGSKLAQRIINFREKLGGFYAVDQVAETFGLPDSTFQKNKARFFCAESAIRKININAASVDALKQHPYIKWNLARAIIAYRQQHGPFQSIGQLEQIAIISREDFIKLLPYLSIE